jgi:hypothetical protein
MSGDQVKSEGRNPKSESRPKPEIRGLGFCTRLAPIALARLKASLPSRLARHGLDFGFRISGFLRPSDFGLRIFARFPANQ